MKEKFTSVSSFVGLGKEARLFTNSNYPEGVGKPCQSAGSFWLKTKQGSECDGDT